MRTLFFLFFVVSISACTKSEVELPSGGSLEGGTWSTGCLAAGSASQIRTSSFSSGTYNHSINLYSGTTCSIAAAVLSEDGSYTVSGSNLDKTLSQLTITLQSASAVTDYNTASMCGFNDWAIGVTKDVTGLSCAGEAIPSAGQVYYDLYDIENMDIPELGTQIGDLKFGYFDAAHDGTTPEKRPTSMDGNYVFRKE